MTYLPYAAAAAVGYLLGAIPFGVLVARWHGVDIMSVGSRNPGATNVKRVIGKRAGNLVFLLDFVKGLLATAWVRFLDVEIRTVVWLGLIGLSAAVLGHCFSVFIGFRGGKGVATSLGGTVALMPVAALVGAVVWVLLFYTTRYVSVASIGLAGSLPVVAYFHQFDRVLFIFALLLAVFVIVLHRANLVRLVQGTENRFQRKGGPPPPEQGGGA